MQNRLIDMIDYHTIKIVGTIQFCDNVVCPTSYKTLKNFEKCPHDFLGLFLENEVVTTFYIFFTKNRLKM